MALCWCVHVFLETVNILNLRFILRKCDVVNRGLSGYNSRWAKIILPRLINCPNTADTKIAAVTVFFGANDCSLEGTLN